MSKNNPTFKPGHWTIKGIEELLELTTVKIIDVYPRNRKAVVLLDNGIKVILGK